MDRVRQMSRLAFSIVLATSRTEKLIVMLYMKKVLLNDRYLIVHLLTIRQLRINCARRVTTRARLHSGAPQSLQTANDQGFVPGN